MGEKGELSFDQRQALWLALKYMAKRFYGIKPKDEKGEYLEFSHKEWVPLYTLLGDTKVPRRFNGFNDLHIRKAPSHIEVTPEEAKAIAKEITGVIVGEDMQNIDLMIRDICVYGELHDQKEYYKESILKIKENLEILRDFCLSSGGFHVD